MEGQDSTALSEQGHSQAQRLGQALLSGLQNAEPNPGQSIYLYSSPLLRATQTAQQLVTALQQGNRSYRYQLASELQELHQGVFQGLTWAQAQAQYPELCDRLTSTLVWQAVPEAESLTAARARACEWIEQILQIHSPGDVVWAVSHEGILQHLIAVIMGCDRTWKIPIAHTAIFEFWLCQSQWQSLGCDRFNPEFWVLRRFNDGSHLALK
jgi:broad specificity phosphatase PhoE